MLGLHQLGSRPTCFLMRWTAHPIYETHGGGGNPNPFLTAELEQSAKLLPAAFFRGGLSRHHQWGKMAMFRG